MIDGIRGWRRLVFLHPLRKSQHHHHGRNELGNNNEGAENQEDPNEQTAVVLPGGAFGPQWCDTSEKRSDGTTHFLKGCIFHNIPLIIDTFVKSPDAALRFTLRHRSAR